LYDFLTKLADKGWDIVVHSTRTVKGIEVWLDKFELSGFISEVSNTKPPALIYLDDRGITFTGDYDQALELIDNFKVYWQEGVKS
jgi:phosphoglycolate phosphatase-like HAD superfamily hydrolase